MEDDMANETNHDFLKGMVLGTILGGAVGALVALLYAPKPGNELRRQISDTAVDIYDKAQGYYTSASGVIKEKSSAMYNEGRDKAQAVVNNAKQQASDLISKAENVISDAKGKASQFQTGVRAGVDAFKTEMKNDIQE